MRVGYAFLLLVRVRHDNRGNQFRWMGIEIGGGVMIMGQKSTKYRHWIWIDIPSRRVHFQDPEHARLTDDNFGWAPHRRDMIFKIVFNWQADRANSNYWHLVKHRFAKEAKSLSRAFSHACVPFFLESENTYLEYGKRFWGRSTHSSRILQYNLEMYTLRVHWFMISRPRTPTLSVTSVSTSGT